MLSQAYLVRVRAHRFTKIKQEHKSDVTIISLLGRSLRDREQFVESVAGAIDFKVNSDVCQKTISTQSGGMSRFVTLRKSSTREDSPRVYQALSRWSILAEMLRQHRGDEPVILCIDEAQNISTQSEFFTQEPG